jgi:hypothetical protein
MAGLMNLSRFLSRGPLLSVSELSRRASRTCPAPTVELSRNLSRACPVGNRAETGQTHRPLRAVLSRPAALVELVLCAILAQAILSALGLIVGATR